MNRSCNAHPEPFSAHAGEDVQILVGPPFGRDLRSRIAPRASIKFLADAFAVWCDQKSRLAGARATGLLDDESHDALAEAYARTRELISALLARVETIERTARQAPRPPTARADAYQGVPGAASVVDAGGRAAGEPPEGRRSDGVGAKRPSTWEGEPPGEPPRARNCPAC